MDEKKLLVAANVLMWVFQALYTISPIDLIPDFLPLLGWVDDLLLFGATAGFTVYTLSVLWRRGSKALVAARTKVDRPDPLAPEAIDRAYGSRSAAFSGYEPLTIEELEAL